MLRVGLISDTHNLLRPAATAFLEGSNYIIHAGDIGSPAILDGLAALAPVTAVRGNNDRDTWAKLLRQTEILQVGMVRVLVVHDLLDLQRAPPPAGVRVVVSGHSHKPVIREQQGVLYVNPGSCGPRRFRLPIALGELLIDGRDVTARIAELEG